MGDKFSGRIVVLLLSICLPCGNMALFSFICREAGVKTERVYFMRFTHFEECYESMIFHRYGLASDGCELLRIAMLSFGVRDTRL